jgi:hypothetical protein
MNNISLLRKYLLRCAPYVFIFAGIFVLIYAIYSQFGTMWDYDSGSYYYLVSIYRGEIPAFPDIMRPPLYPLFLLLTYILGGKYHFFSTLYCAQSALMSFGFVLLFSLGKKLFNNTILSSFYIIFCFLCYPAVRLLALIGPEGLLTVLIVVFLYISMFIQKNVLYMIFIVCVLTALTFTKPIFLYFPVIVGVFYIFLTIKQFITKRHLCMFFLGIIFLYCIPVFLWSNGNLNRNKYFTFSNVKEINVLGKLLQYNLIDKGPDTVDALPIKQWVYQFHGINPYSLINDIQMAHGANAYEQRAIELALYTYGSRTYQYNFLEYTLKSLKYVPFVISSIADYSQYAPNTQNTTSSEVMFYLYITLYKYCYIHIISLSFVALFVLSMANGVRYCVEPNTKMSKYSYVFLLLCIFTIYYIVVVAFAGYDSFPRFMSILYFEVILLFFMTLYDLARGCAAKTKRAK